MKTFVDSQQHILRPEHLSDEDYFGILDQLDISRKDQVKTKRDLVPKIDAVLDQHKQEVIDLMGGTAAYERFQSQRKQQIKKFEEIESRLDRGSAGLAEIKKARESLRSAEETLLRKAKIDTAKLSTLNENAIKTVNQLWTLDFERERVPKELVSTEEAMRYIEANRGFNEHPARFDGTSWNWSYTRRDTNRPLIEQFDDYTTGRIGNHIYVYDTDTGDNSRITVTCHTGVGFFYTMPADGSLEIWADLENEYSSYSYFYLDEYGTSSSYFTLGETITLNVMEPEFHARDFVYSWRTVGFEFDPYDHSGNAFNPGTHRWANLTSNRNYKQGQTVYIEIGSELELYQQANDVTYVDSSNFRWYVRRLFLHIAP